MLDETMKQLGIDDIVAVGMILIGDNNVSTRAKLAGATKGTSRASLYSRRVFKKSQFPLGIKLPTIVGGPIKNVKIVLVRNIGTFVGRTIPFAGLVILANDVYVITSNTVIKYNKIARKEDRLW